MKKIRTIIFFLIILLTGGVFLWNIFTSPGYSLKQLDKAIKEHNIITFQKYVDLDNTVDSIIVQTWEYYLSGEETGKLGIEIWSKINNTIFSAIKPNLKEIIKEKIFNYISTGKWQKNGDNGQEWILLKFITFVKGKIDPEQWVKQSINYVKINGNIAQAGITYFDEMKKTNFLLEIKMRNMGSYWQIIEISNFTHILKMYRSEN